MSRKKASLLVQAMAIFNQLDDRDRATLAEYVKLTAAPRRLPKLEPAKKGTVAEPICGVCGNGTEEQSSYSSYRVVPRKSSRKETVAGPICGLCGNPADHSDHDKSYLSSHPFEAKKSLRKAKAGTETESALAASV